jgi:hypothetical protein
MEGFETILLVKIFSSASHIWTNRVRAEKGGRYAC